MTDYDCILKRRHLVKRINFSVIMLGVAAFLISCGGKAAGPAANTANAANANVAKPAASAPDKAELFAFEKQANEAFYKGDSKLFEGLLSDKFVSREGADRMDKPALLTMIANMKCDVKSWSLDDDKMTAIDADTYVLSYRGTWVGTCSGNSEPMKIPSPTRAATIWVRSGDKWQAAFHGENLIVDTTATASTSAKKEEPKKDEKIAGNSGAKSAGDGNTDALVKVELAVWEGWKNRDRKTLEELTAKDVVFIDIFGNVTSSKADTIKLWTEHKCEIESVSYTEGFASALSPTVEILTGDGTANGTCNGQKLSGPIYGTSVYVKEGEAWRLAFTMNMPSM